jgi:pantoate--beta-alanine ligase
MEIIRTVAQMKNTAAAWKAAGLTVGLVPTMGCLHEGHMSLVRKAVSDNDRVIVSIFVNPIQFGENEDFDRYPRNTEKDSELCEHASVDAIFSPSASEMYPGGFCSHTDVSGLTEGLCGAWRPNHFRGVCTVVAKLFNLTTADRAYFGRKDAQQLAVVRRMVIDMNMDVEIIDMPIVREEDGLAMSSRNAYLSDGERASAVRIHSALSEAARLCLGGERDIGLVKRRVRDMLSAIPSAAVEYVEIVDEKTMRPPTQLASDVLCAVAVRVGKTRLIDNAILSLGTQLANEQ